ncbi:MAG: PorT family protein [Cytophagales bacterium]|nr:MAG: PorT family protein [Cytophagales bacterium]
MKRSIITIGLLLLLITSVNAQKQKHLLVAKPKSLHNKNVGSFTNNKSGGKTAKALTYGFLVGLNFNRFMVADNEPANPNTVITVNPRVSNGFALGFLANLRLNENFDLRISPTAGFYERSIDYTIRTFAPTGTFSDTVINKNVENIMLELPIVVKFKGQLRGEKNRYSNMYLLAGIKPSYSMSAAKDADNELLRTNPFDVSVEVGFGLDKRYQYFKFSPELRFSFGLINALQQDNNNFSLPIRKANTFSLSLLFHFN